MTPHLRLAAAATLAFVERDFDGFKSLTAGREADLVGPLTALASSLALDTQDVTGLDAREHLREILTDDDVSYLD